MSVRVNTPQGDDIEGLGAEVWAESPLFLSDAGASALAPETSERQERGESVVFYRLGRRFVDNEASIPEDARDVLYYTLSVGHHVGVIDCFERALTMPLASYRTIVGLLESEEARFKLSGVWRFGEIEIDKMNVPCLLPALRACLANLDVFNEPGKTEIPLDGLEVSMLMAFVDAVLKVRDEPGMYLMVRREAS